MSAKVVKLHHPKPRTFTTPEAILDAVRERMFSCKLTQKQIATGANISHGTVGKIMNGTTRWPRPTTLFPIMSVLKMRLTVEFED